MKRNLILLVIIFIVSGCDTTMQNSPKYCKDNGYKGMVLTDTDIGADVPSCSDGEISNGYYKTSNGMKKVVAIEPTGKVSRTPGNFYLEFK